ncbi:MAG: UDP-N-acetylmuramate dehydrogenase [Candidatus Eremiobacterota bacterium]
MKRYEQFINKFSGKILKDELLSEHSSFKIGGPADIMVMAGTTDVLEESVSLCLDMKLPFFMLGGGTNIVFHDKGFRGIVIKNLCNHYSVEGEKVFVESGVIISRFAEDMAVRSLKGLESLGGLPGTVGGAIVGNAGAYGASIGDVLTSAKIFLLKERKTVDVERDFFDFRYRYSRLKTGEVKGVILSATLHMACGNRDELLAVIEKDRYKRKTLHPTEPSAGCIFKNIEFSDTMKKNLYSHSLEGLIIHNKLPAGKLIELAGLKGMSSGDACVSTVHGNYIVNMGKATCGQVKELISIVKKKIKEDFNIDFEEEVLFIPEFLYDKPVR